MGEREGVTLVQRFEENKERNLEIWQGNANRVRLVRV